MTRIIIIISLLVFQNTVLFSQEGWALTKDSEEIKVYTKAEEGYAFKTFKGTTVINASIHDFVYTLLDLNKYPDWGHNVKSARKLDRKGDTLQVYYSIAKAPFPYKNRDGIYRNRFDWNPEKNILLVSIEVLDDYIEEDEKYIRVKGNGYWKAEVLSNNKLNVTFLMQVDPGGTVPSWLANMFVEDTPFNTLAGLKIVVEENKEKNSNYNFID